MLTIVDRYGRIIWNTPPYPGSTPDQSIWNQEKFRNWFIETDAGIIGDQGFTFNTKDVDERIIAYTPFPFSTTLGDDKESLERMDFNKLLSKRRVVVEHTFKRLKQFRIIGGLCRHFHPNREKNSQQHNYFDFNMILEVLCCIHNRDLISHPDKRP